MPSAPTPRRVLVVEDRPDVDEVLAELVAVDGGQV
jgi:CheY-like chemotaxis protein